MRSRTAALAAAMLCASLYGCTSSVQQSGRISGAATGAASGGPGAAATVSLAPVAGLSMSFKIPSDLSLEFQTADQGSATANQIQTILVYQYEAFIEALSSGDAADPNFRHLTFGDALTTETSELAWWKKQNERLTGVDRLYAFTVSPAGKGQAEYSYCEDSARLDYLNLANGQTIQNTAGTTDNYTLRQGILVQGKGEQWAVEQLLTKDGAASCIGK